MVVTKRGVIPKRELKKITGKPAQHNVWAKMFNNIIDPAKTEGAMSHR